VEVDCGKVYKVIGWYMLKTLFMVAELKFRVFLEFCSSMVTRVSLRVI
jgi:hypothetical protein